MRALPVAVGTLGGALVIAAAPLGVAAGRPADVVGDVALLAFPIVALTIIRAQPRSPVAWCFLVSTVLFGVERAGADVATLGVRHGWPDGITHFAAWTWPWTWFPGLFLLLTVALLRFPDGRLVGPRWRWVERAAVAAMLVWMVGMAASSWGLPTRVLLSTTPPAPTGVAGVLQAVAEPMFAVVVACTAASLASLIVRYRHSGPVGQLQVRWVLVAAVVAVLLEVALTTYGLAAADTPYWVQSVGEGVGLAIIAVATGVAITRHRLYEIDRIVSRTVTYGLVLAVLAGVYVGVVAGLAALLPADVGQVGVAAATLVVAVLAVPLTRRVRRVVDRRFNRSRFDADRIVRVFAARLRARPDRGDIGADLLDVLARTVQPVHAGVWQVPR